MDDVSNVSELGWTAIVITCTSVKTREALEEECRRLSKGGLLPKHEFLLVVDDPQAISQVERENTAIEQVTGVGSGGATINALLIAIERLSAFHNHTTINNELVYSSRILVVHHGRTLVHSPGGSAFLRVDAEQLSVPPNLRIIPPTLLQHAVWMATCVSAKSKKGVWVTSLDAFLPHSSLMEPPDTEGFNGAVVCTVPTSLDHAEKHGVVVSGRGNFIEKMEYKMPVEQLKEVFSSQTASVISGIVFLSSSLAEQLLGLHMQPPLDRCTYYGTDSGIPPLQVSLYFDLLAPLCSGVTQEEYIQGLCGVIYAKTANYNTRAHQESRMARLQIWKGLQGLKAVSHKLEGVHHRYLSSDMPYKTCIWPLLPSFPLKVPEGTSSSSCMGTNAYIEGCVNEHQGKVHIFDSWIGKDVVINCKQSCVFSGFHLLDKKLSLDLNDEFIWQCYYVKGKKIITCYGMSDGLSLHHNETGASVFNSKYPIFLQRTGLSSNDLWPQMENSHHTLLNAKIFISDASDNEQIDTISLMIKAIKDDHSQTAWMSKVQQWRNTKRISLSDVVENCDVMYMMKKRDEIHLETIKQLIHETADEVGGQSLLPLFQYSASREPTFVDEILCVLHRELQAPRASTSRLLANVADLLGCMAQGRGGLRSGPAANLQWKNALVELKAGNQKQALDQMVSVCRLWIASRHPEDLIRAARHYERASQIIISRQVETAEMNVKIPWQTPKLKERVKIGEWVEAQTPARIDLAGGWSDTPPVCYEQGGAVLNIAIKINKQKPIGARVRFTENLHVSCTLRDWSGGDLSLIWTELDHLRDFDNPVAPGALIKAVLLYCRTVDLSSDESLATQLKNKFGGGIEVEVWSNLPQGSGLGGSSLLAGTLVAALAVLYGHPPPLHSHLIHATLLIEQWLTTGGGWQDQIGGLVGGAKLGVSKRGTPVTVSTYKIPLSKEFTNILNKHLLLLYTGKVRLARNLLQTVIRNWYARDETVIECFAKLQVVALDAAKAMLNSNISHLGSCIDEYWTLKKKVASGCEPMRVTKLMASLRDHCYGMSLAGAGGGGYFYALKTDAEPLPESLDLGELTCDLAELDEEGLEIWRNGEKIPQRDDSDCVLTEEVWSKLQKSVL